VRLTALPAAERLAQPWKNGGGTTREVAAAPDGVGFDFDWRVSLAQVDAGGPFSRFAGVDRILTVLEGAMRLTVEGREPVTLDADAGPYAFAGDADCSARMIAPVIDLNVMTRRGAWTATVTRLDVDGETRLALSEAVTLLVVAQGRMRLLLGDRAEALDRHDAVRIEDGAGHGLIVDGSAVAYRIALTARG
jgi:environmental stress-induced protein Ves